MSFLPVFLTVYLMVRYYVIVPVWDDWELVLALDKLSSQTLTFKDLFAFHNEHRIFFPRTIMLGIAALTHWNLLYTQFASVLVVLGSFALVIASMRNAERSASVTISPWVYLPLTIILFSLTQWENWTRGWQIQIFLAVLGALGSFYFLSKPKISWTALASSVALALLASFSFANGILVWPIGFLLLLTRLFDRPKEQAANPRTLLLSYLSLWTVISVLSILIYFSGYQSPSYHPPVTLFLSHPVEFIQFVFLYVGHVVIYPHNKIVILGILSGVVGILGTGLFIFCIFYLARVRNVPWNTLLPFIGMGLFSLSSAVVTGVGRVGFGITSALASKYASIGLYLWIANVFFLFIIYRLNDIPTEFHAAKGGVIASLTRHIASIPAPFVRKTSLSLIALIAICSLINSLESTKKIQYYHRYFTAAIPQMMAPGDTTLYIRIYPDAEALDRYLALARKNRVSIFRSDPAEVMDEVRSIGSLPEPDSRTCPTDLSFAVDVTEFADTDSTIICEGTATWQGNEVGSEDIVLVFTGRSGTYRVKTRERIIMFERNRGFFALVLKSSLPPGEYAISVACSADSRCSALNVDKTFAVR